jgi:hypothetical protein
MIARGEVIVLGTSRLAADAVADILTMLGAVVERRGTHLDAVEAATRAPVVVCIDAPQPGAAAEEAWLVSLEQALVDGGAANRLILTADDLRGRPSVALRRLAAFASAGHRVDDAFVARTRGLLRRLPPVPGVPPSTTVAALYAAICSATTPEAYERIRLLAHRALVDHSRREGGQTEREPSRAEPEILRVLRREHEKLQAAIAQLNEAASRTLPANTAEASPTPESPPSAAERQRQYEALVARVRNCVETAVPAGSTVAVVSRGDPQLLLLNDRRGWHFPQVDGGGYAGHHPADGADAVAHLVRVQRRGARYLVFPATSRWWLDHYAELRTLLEDRHELVHDEAETCAIYRLREPAELEVEQTSPGGHGTFDQVADLLCKLLPSDAVIAVVTDADAQPPSFDGLTTIGLPIEPQSRHTAADPAIAGLEDARTHGANYLLVPTSCGELLERHRELRRHLDDCYRLVTDQQHVAAIYDLTASNRRRAHKPQPHERIGSLVG